ncbi:para-nitrobenzyl esterase [Microbulbifer donghaiensis]|uniref:Carboxylic ester hydrolase n=1 Tax=Microbulbifer donghaiensis TaxID=494016 RepID=A0A1M5G7Y1_9GAMM|nr:carboxylesterase family protein [Microbulbifer donghaiensis]SHF99826.1 para-nitrobenzyl esterase [Microbulbifer donghaiensis]
MTSDASIGRHNNKIVKMTPVVDTPAGPILGSIDAETGVHRFQGIPYAQPPIGELRWQPPQPVPSKVAPFHAFDFGMPAAQNPSTLFVVRGPNGELPESEDCLYLNIFAPPVSKHSNKKLPVMLWIHGGSFYMGSGCQEIYNGCHLAASGRAIVVTINYRLGALGFLRLQDISEVPSSGNEGLLDQIAALKWIRTNIAAFGGDVDNITLFGESAGAMSIAALLAAPACRGLFRRAIVQSGHPRAIHSRDKANCLAEAFIEHLEKISGKQNPLQADTKSILNAQQAVLADTRMEQYWGQLPFKPVLDGELISLEPMQVLRDGNSANVSLLLGSNLEEWNLFSAIHPESFTLDSEQIRARLEWLLPRQQLDPLLDHYYTVAQSLEDNPWPEWSRVWNLLLTDMVFTLPGLRLLDAHRGQRYHYHFAQPLAAQPLLGACHAVELGYIFGTHGKESLQSLYGGETDAHTLSSVMREAWLNFAECGNPGSDWPSFADGRSHRFGNHPAARSFDPAELTSLWQHIPDEVLNRYL